jgi:hypothetical protein
MARTIHQIDLRMDDLERLVDGTRHAPLTEDEHAHLKSAIDTLGYIAHLLEQRGTTIAGLRYLLLGAQTEKTRDVLARVGDPADAPTATAPETDRPVASVAPPGERRRRGHGRHAAAAYAGRHTSRCRTRICVTGIAARSAPRARCTRSAIRCARSVDGAAAAD